MQIVLECTCTITAIPHTQIFIKNHYQESDQISICNKPQSKNQEIYGPLEKKQRLFTNWEVPVEKTLPKVLNVQIKAKGCGQCIQDWVHSFSLYGSAKVSKWHNFPPKICLK